MNEIILYDTPFNDFVVMRPEELWRKGFQQYQQLSPNDLPIDSI